MRMWRNVTGASRCVSLNMGKWSDHQYARATWIVLRARATLVNITAVRVRGKTSSAESIVSKVIYGRRSVDQFAGRCQPRCCMRVSGATFNPAWLLARRSRTQKQIEESVSEFETKRRFRLLCRAIYFRDWSPPRKRPLLEIPSRLYTFVTIIFVRHQFEVILPFCWEVYKSNFLT